MKNYNKLIKKIVNEIDIKFYKGVIISCHDLKAIIEKIN